MVKNHVVCSFTNKLVNEAANDSAWASGQDRKKPPTLGINQNAGFGGFRPLASLEKNNTTYYSLKIIPQFSLAKSTCIIHHNQLLMTKFGRIFCLTRK